MVGFFPLREVFDEQVTNIGMFVPSFETAKICFVSYPEPLKEDVD